MDWREQPYQHDSTASRLLSEVKHVRACLVLCLGTTLESKVLFTKQVVLFSSTSLNAIIYLQKFTRMAQQIPIKQYMQCVQFLQFLLLLFQIVCLTGIDKSSMYMPHSERMHQ